MSRLEILAGLEIIRKKIMYSLIIYEIQTLYIQLLGAQYNYCY